MFIWFQKRYTVSLCCRRDQKFDVSIMQEVLNWNEHFVQGCVRWRRAKAVKCATRIHAVLPHLHLGMFKWPFAVRCLCLLFSSLLSQSLSKTASYKEQDVKTFSRISLIRRFTCNNSIIWFCIAGMTKRLLAHVTGVALQVACKK